MAGRPDPPLWDTVPVLPLLLGRRSRPPTPSLVHRVLNVRLIARKALQYALARYSAIALAVVPMAALALYFYSHRELDDRRSSSPAAPTCCCSARPRRWGSERCAIAGNLLDSIDRHFFREQYDARQTLTLLVERIRATHGVTDLANLLCREADLALHPESVSLMAFDPRSGMLADPKVRSRRLDASSSLAALIASASDPLPVVLDGFPLAARQAPREGAPLAGRQRLPDDRADPGARRLAARPDRARREEERPPLPQGGPPAPARHRQQRRLGAGAGAEPLARLLAAERTGGGGRGRRLNSPADSAAANAELARECPNCGRLYPSYTVFCTSCSRRLEPSHLPYVLPGKFRFERRIGTGGMGIVYRGVDISLSRAVAVKTLRRVSPEDAMRLRREARTAAAVSHPHLAPVYGMETWQGTPMLVMELLEGGTLTQRIEKGRLEAAETVELGIAMAEALEHLHASDILHRDIKPSNIGYARDGTPKLMDFGIARVMFDLRRDLEAPPRPTWTRSRSCCRRPRSGASRPPR